MNIISGYIEKFKALLMDEWHLWAFAGLLYLSGMLMAVNLWVSLIALAVVFIAGVYFTIKKG